MGTPISLQTQQRAFLRLDRTQPSRLSVLIADDSSMVRNRLRELLSTIRGVSIEGEVHSAIGALDFIQEHRPDIVILDIQMPGGSGFKVLQRVKIDHPETTVIIMTNYPYPQYKKKYLTAGADYFLDKSTEFETLIEIIRQMSGDRLFQRNN